MPVLTSDLHIDTHMCVLLHTQISMCTYMYRVLNFEHIFSFYIYFTQIGSFFDKWKLSFCELVCCKISSLANYDLLNLPKLNFHDFQECACNLDSMTSFITWIYVYKTAYCEQISRLNLALMPLKLRFYPRDL